MYVKLILLFLYLSETIGLYTLLVKAWMGPAFSIVITFVWSVETNNYTGKSSFKSILNCWERFIYPYPQHRIQSFRWSLPTRVLRPIIERIIEASSHLSIRLCC